MCFSRLLPIDTAPTLGPTNRPTRSPTSSPGTTASPTSPTTTPTASPTPQVVAPASYASYMTVQVVGGASEADIEGDKALIETLVAKAAGLDRTQVRVPPHVRLWDQVPT